MARIVGVIGGVGPLAGVDLHRKIISNTKAYKDEEHIPIVHISFSCDIPDRTEYVLHADCMKNPAEALFRIVKSMYAMGVEIVGIPCNSAHVPAIFSVLQESVQKEFGDALQLVHMVQEVLLHIKESVYDPLTVGVLATLGTYMCDTYKQVFEQENITVLYPETIEQKTRVHNSIYHPQYGIKALSHDISDYAKNILIEESKKLIDRGAQSIIMGCTEIPLAINQSNITVPLIDPTNILARVLVNYSDSSKLL